MIKFIATDLDGTLLADNKIINPEVFKTIERLFNRGTIFSPASSRPVTSLKKVFAPVLDKVCIIANNGAKVIKDGKYLIRRPMPFSLAMDIIEECKKYETVNILVDADIHSYSDSSYICEVMNSPLFMYETKYVKDYTNITEDIFKISIVDKTDTDIKIRNAIYENLKNRCNMSISGEGCLDFVDKNVSKGIAIRELLDIYNISYNDAMVFGDNYNDADMLESAAFSFAMKNAEEGVKKFARFVTKEDNNNDGVLKTIKEYCFEV